MSVIIKILYFVLSLVRFFIPVSKNRCAIITFPDFDDNARALCENLSSKNISIYILLTQNNIHKPSWLPKNVKIVRKNSILGLLNYFRSRYIFYTHGGFSQFSLRKNQVVINVWHGMPIKRIFLLEENSTKQVPRFHYFLASNQIYKEILCSAFGVSEEKCLILPSPRLDILLRESPKRKEFPKKLVVWLPTYRESVIGDKRIDGDIRLEEPRNFMDLKEFDLLLQKYNAFCFYKPHPASALKCKKIEGYKNIKEIHDDDLIRMGVTLYELLSISCMLITDVSSVLIDYRKTSKQIIIFWPDYKLYKITRGFIFPIEKIVHEKIITNLNDFYSEFEIQLRKIPQDILHKEKQPSFTNMLLEIIGINKSL